MLTISDSIPRAGGRQMTEPLRDQWAEWLLNRGTAGDKAGWVEFLRPVRDRVLENASLSECDTLLDVGAGDGMIAFGALERMGAGGQVIFADVSQDLLDHSRALAKERGLSASRMRRATGRRRL
jgi:arsenite methyltransferase